MFPDSFFDRRCCARRWSRGLIVLWLALLFSAPVLGQLEEVAAVERDQVLSLGLVLRDLAPRYLEDRDADPRVHAVLRESTSWFVEEGSTFERYFAFAQALMVLERGDWGPHEAVASALGFELERSILDPGDSIVIQPHWFFALEAPEGGLAPELEQALEKVQVHFRLENAEGTSLIETQRSAMELVARRPIELAGRSPDGPALDFGSALVIEIVVPPGPSASPPNNDKKSNDKKSNDKKSDKRKGKPKKGKTAADAKGSRKEIRGTELRLVARLPVVEIAELEDRTRTLRDQIDLLASRGVASTGAGQELAMTTVDWVLQNLRALSQVGRGGPPGPVLVHSYVEGTRHELRRVDWTERLQTAEELVAALRDGQHPLAGRRGELLLAYESPWDHQKVPFRLYLPPVGSESPVEEKLATVVVLHGAGGDEGSPFDRSAGALTEAARSGNMAVLSVNGRGPFNPWVADAAADVIDALDIVKKAFPVDPKRIFLFGHAMGGAGAMEIGFAHPELFRAIAALAGYASDELVSLAPDMPLLIAHGELDRVLPVDDARSFRAGAMSAGSQIQYIEVARADHYEILGSVMDDVFDFFERVSESTP